MMKRNTGTEEVDDDLFSLACGPNFRVKKFSSHIINGVRFNIVDRDKNKTTRNSGVITQKFYLFLIIIGLLVEISDNPTKHLAYFRFCCNPL